MKKYKIVFLMSGLLVGLLFASCSAVIDTHGGISTSPLTEIEGSSRSAAWTGAPVRLVYARGFNYAVSGMSFNASYIYARVQNIGNPGSRVLSVHYDPNTNEPSEPWVTAPMEFVANNGNYSFYRITLGPSTTEFVLRYDTSQGTYWDNNGGQNYRTRPWTNGSGFVSGAVGGNIALNIIRRTGSHPGYAGGQPVITVEAYVENLSFHKEVFIVYSFNGSTWHQANLNYYNSGHSQSPNVEIWGGQFSRPVEEAGATGPVRFALAYRNLETGQEYWDNNFNQDYYFNYTPIDAVMQ